MLLVVWDVAMQLYNLPHLRRLCCTLLCTRCMARAWCFVLICCSVALITRRCSFHTCHTRAVTYCAWNMLLYACMHACCINKPILKVWMICVRECRHVGGKGRCGLWSRQTWGIKWQLSVEDLHVSLMKIGHDAGHAAFSMLPMCLLTSRDHT